MKNLFLLPTDKPSRLWLSTRKENYLVFDKFPRAGVKYVAPQHIYIISNEEVRVGDWFICIKDNNFVDKSLAHELDIINQNFNDYKKIILTTDSELIADEVQPIDDTFLEWFVKNPTCEFVEVESRLKAFDEQNREIDFAIEKTDYTKNVYQIIIPQNIIQTKEDADIFYKELENPSEPNEKLKKAFKKQETLEEAAERLAKNHCDIRVNSNTTEFQIQQLIIKGAKWEQEQYKSTLEDIRRDEEFKFSLKSIDTFSEGYDAGYADAEKIMYSEDEVYNILEQAIKDCYSLELEAHYSGDYKNLKQYFEQIKKK